MQNSPPGTTAFVASGTTRSNGKRNVALRRLTRGAGHSARATDHTNANKNMRIMVLLGRTVGLSERSQLSSRRKKKKKTTFFSSGKNRNNAVDWHRYLLYCDSFVRAWFVSLLHTFSET